MQTLTLQKQRKMTKVMNRRQHPAYKMAAVMLMESRGSFLPLTPISTLSSSFMMLLLLRLLFSRQLFHEVLSGKLAPMH